MIRHAAWRLALLLPMVAPVAARAEPPRLPAHDVTITYRVEGAARDLLPGISSDLMRIFWNAEREQIRAEPQGYAGFALINLEKGTAILVDSGLHSAMSLPVNKRDLDPIRLQDARLQPVGQETVADRRCTDYDVLSRRGSGTICLAADGVALRGSGTINGRQGSFVAVAIDDATLPQAMFAPPAGFFQLTLPRGLRLPQ